MTFTIKTRGAAGLIASEYMCPEHGRFDQLLVDPPDEMPCPGDTEYDPCGRDCPWVISAPKPKVLSIPCYAAVRGGDTERRPGMLDTRPLAEGQSMTDWRKDQDKGREARRYDELKRKGLLTPKVFSK